MRVLCDSRPPIVKMVDDATGYQKVIDDLAHKEMQAFISFVFEVIWIPLLEEALNSGDGVYRP